MNSQLKEVLDNIGKTYQHQIQKGARNYIEINIGVQAEKLGYPDLMQKYRGDYAIVPLKDPQPGMKVRIDGRTFVNYTQYDSGVAVPGFIAAEAGGAYAPFVPNDSMICNFV